MVRATREFEPDSETIYHGDMRHFLECYLKNPSEARFEQLIAILYGAHNRIPLSQIPRVAVMVVPD